MMSRLIPVMAAETLVSVPLLKTTVPKPVLEGSIAEVAKMLGYENVKNSQKEAITAFLQGKDVFCFVTDRQRQISMFRFNPRHCGLAKVISWYALGSEECHGHYFPAGESDDEIKWIDTLPRDSVV